MSASRRKLARRSTTTRAQPVGAAARRGGGTDIASNGPTAGWKSHRVLAFANPRTPAVPATLDLQLDDYFAAATLMGLLASQAEKPEKEWACEWSFAMGEIMARRARERRRQFKPKGAARA